MAFSEQPNPTMVPPPAPPNANVRGKVRQPTGDPNNPYGLGDPDDMTLRKVEKDVMIPIKMRDRGKTEKCTELVTSFSECCKDAGLLMVVTCRKENSALKACLTKWYNDEGFKKECTEQYLKERSEYRRTGIKHKDMQKYLA